MWETGFRMDNGTNSYLIGSLQSALTIKETFTGDIDDVRIYGRALAGRKFWTPIMPHRHRSM